ncbi:Trafficking protein particle complex subunit 3 [Vitis vinifera]|uniref:Trafficking protein particle complex subunit 3 n=1 Tax=Vitis vinifera TaxID=29760 RepID=A0A438DY08_VITVI|nr:Trafficking protein particle complex subunit 3 [Vitis vinifera]
MFQFWVHWTFVRDFLSSKVLRKGRKEALGGYNIGIRLIDEFLAKSNVSRCVDFKETAEAIAKVYYSFTV